MATIYFHYHELLRQSADQAVRNGRENHPNDDEDQQQRAAIDKLSKTEKLKRAKENQDEDGALKSPFNIHTDTEATLAALQPRMNRLAYLQTAGATNLEALTRSLGPKL
ncbi:hypothetical protein P3T76_014290 [Phytophthora citrophthora]|uniref:Uncharacterized protein n=1 Tax=Phytophthora citrophthora TaxID=4793 RepID=A0AAD9G201_9STRA|nr:hypothetical protein P3T76_014290 [Phytophthora citrophthora]